MRLVKTACMWNIVDESKDTHTHARRNHFITGVKQRLALLVICAALHDYTLKQSGEFRVCINVDVRYVDICDARNYDII